MRWGQSAGCRVLTVLSAAEKVFHFRIQESDEGVTLRDTTPPYTGPLFPSVEACLAYFHTHGPICPSIQVLTQCARLSAAQPPKPGSGGPGARWGTPASTPAGTPIQTPAQARVGPGAGTHTPHSSSRRGLQRGDPMAQSVYGGRGQQAQPQTTEPPQSHLGMHRGHARHGGHGGHGGHAANGGHVRDGGGGPDVDSDTNSTPRQDSPSTPLYREIRTVVINKAASNDKLGMRLADEHGLVRVSNVQPDEIAAQHGIKVGWELLSVNGAEVKDAAAARRLVAMSNSITFTFWPREANEKSAPNTAPSPSVAIGSPPPTPMPESHEEADGAGLAGAPRASQTSRAPRISTDSGAFNPVRSITLSKGPDGKLGLCIGQ